MKNFSNKILIVLLLISVTNFSTASDGIAIENKKYKVDEIYINSIRFYTQNNKITRFYFDQNGNITISDSTNIINGTWLFDQESKSLVISGPNNKIETYNVNYMGLSALILSKTISQNDSTSKIVEIRLSIDQ